MENELQFQCEGAYLIDGNSENINQKYESNTEFFVSSLFILVVVTVIQPLIAISFQKHSNILSNFYHFILDFISNEHKNINKKNSSNF